MQKSSVTCLPPRWLFFARSASQALAICHPYTLSLVFRFDIATVEFSIWEHTATIHLFPHTYTTVKVGCQFCWAGCSCRLHSLNGLLYVRGCIYTYVYVCIHICTVLVYRRLGIKILLKTFLLNLQLEVGRVLLNIAYLVQAPKLNACSHLWNLVGCFGVKYFPLTHLHAITLRKFRCGCLLQVLLSTASLWKLLEVRNIAVISGEGKVQNSVCANF